MGYNCRICGNNSLIKSAYPDALFNNKTFQYLKCCYCSSYNVYPDPTAKDFSKMYGEEDHYYLKNVKNKLTYDFNFSFGDHQGYQIQFLKQIEHKLKGKTLLDYACGSGFYMKYAQNLGAKVIGVEFDKKFVTLLKDKTEFELYTLDELTDNYKNQTFDFIHLGHVLEHLTNPYEVIETLKQFANTETTFLIDGPLDRNQCLHRWIVDFGSKIKNKKNREAAPQHLTLTTYKSQLLFFDKVGLKKEKYIAAETHFPLPSKLEPSIGKIINFFIATTSILLSKLIPNFGNVFHFRGKLK